MLLVSLNPNPDASPPFHGSGLCCKQLVHVKFGAYLVAYIDSMAITAQAAYIAARIAISCCTMWVFALIGLLIFQCGLCFALFYGVKRRILPWIRLYLLLGIVARGVVLAAILGALVGSLTFGYISADFEQWALFLCGLLVFCVVLMIPSGFLVHRCYAYFRGVTALFEAAESNTDLTPRICPNSHIAIRQSAGIVPRDSKQRRSSTSKVFSNLERSTSRCHFYHGRSVDGEKPEHTNIYRINGHANGGGDAISVA